MNIHWHLSHSIPFSFGYTFVSIYFATKIEWIELFGIDRKTIRQNIKRDGI